MEPFLTDAFAYFSDAEMANRYAKVREKMRENNLDVLLVHGSQGIGNSPGQVNLTYLTGYAAVMETFLVVPYDGEPTMCLAVPFHIRNARDFSYVKDIRSGWSLGEAIGRIKELKLEKGRIGLVGPGGSSGAGITLYVENYQTVISMLPDAQLENATNWFDDLRLYKSEEEIAYLRKSAKMNDLIMEDLIHYVRPGLTNRDLRRNVDVMAARHGLTYPFAHLSAINMLDPEDCYPEFYPSTRPVRNQSIILTEFVFGYGNYWNKVWGSFFVGEPTDEYLRMFETASKVYQDTISRLKPGMTGREVNELLQPIEEAEYEQPAFFLVSGWSMMVTRPFMGTLPSNQLSKAAAEGDLDFKLTPGLALTVNVWLRIPETNKGLWIGASGVMTEKGIEILNNYPVDQLRVVGR
ncbi:M24 family metallopeptidase [Pseudogracilibacillus sp. SO30301A]|uniref:M24 family metallopeptidase n=1 Tax=Pseudogracilibacillus sp. SO30301A TaxID=3098291 RepID=UPI00300DFF62